jgi:hypothetical protein
MAPKARPLADRFWEKVRKNFDCWEWTGAKFPSGYGAFQVRRGHSARAHRVAFELTNGQPLGKGALVCHRCDNPGCVRPDHLYLGTPASNMLDRSERGRAPAGDAHYSRFRPEVLARGERHGNSRLTARQVLELRAAHSRGEATRALARKYGISQRAAVCIVNGITWKHLTKPE